jgi:cytidylate kinase
MRRMGQFKKKYGIVDSNIDTLYKQIQKRDFLDINRKIAPLKKEKGTKVINNTTCKRVDTVKKMLFVIHKRYPELAID